jgi:hypothetical protein
LSREEGHEWRVAFLAFGFSSLNEPRAKEKTLPVNFKKVMLRYSEASRPSYFEQFGVLRVLPPSP